MILMELKHSKNAELEFKDELEKLKTIAEDNFEESNYLIGEIQELTGEELDDHFLSFLALKNELKMFN